MKVDKNLILCPTSPRRALLYLWLTTFLVFIISPSIAKSIKPELDLYQRSVLPYLFFGNIILGSVVFLGIIFIKNKPKNKIISFLIQYVLLICFIYFLINTAVFALEGRTFKPDSKKTESNMNLYLLTTPTPVSIPTLSPTPIIKINTQNTNSNAISNNSSTSLECIGPDGKQFNTTMEECKKLNEKWGKPVDYIVNCQMTQNCGGGTKKISKSQCNIITCCQIGNGWYLMSSEEECNQKQKNYYSENFTIPTFSPYSVNIPTTAPIPTIQQTTTPSTPYSTIVPQPTTDPTSCLNYWSSWYTSQQNQCMLQGRSKGVSSSSWVDQCAKDAFNTYKQESENCYK